MICPPMSLYFSLLVSQCCYFDEIFVIKLDSIPGGRQLAPHHVDNVASYNIHTSMSIRLFRKRYFHVSYRRRVHGTLAWQRSGLGDVCQSAKIVPLFN